MFAKKNVKNIYALTPLQEGILFHSLYAGETSSYFEQFGFTITGNLDPVLFEKAWNELIKRHDIFRTIFVHKNVPQPLQIVLKSRDIDFHFEDMSGLSEEEQSARLSRYRKKDRKTPFDLSKDMLMRVSIFRSDGNAFHVTWSFHHILMDGWSVGVVFEELAAVYKALAGGETPTLGRVTPFAEYIKWLKKQDGEATAAYWREYLDGYARPASIPRIADISGDEASGGFIVENFGFGFDEELTGAFLRLAEKNRVTVNTVVQAAWGVLLAKYTGLGDVVFASTVSGRPAEIKGIETMVGMFINTIPVRIRTEDQTFADVLRAAHLEAVAAKPHHYASLADVLTQTALRSNLFDHILIFENYPDLESDSERENEFSVGNFEQFELTDYDLSIQIYPEDELKFHFIYNAAVYDRKTIEKVETHLTAIARAVAADDGVAIREIGLLTAEEEEIYHRAGLRRYESLPRVPDAGGRDSVSAAYVRPENEVEEKLAGIWAEVLKLDPPPGARDNYFELGGHSLSAIRIISAIQKTFEVEIGIREFFDHPEIRKLAEIIQGKKTGGFSNIERLPDQPHYDASHSQKRLWILDRMEKGFTAYNLSTGYLFEGKLNAPVFIMALKQLIARHESLRTTLTSVGDKPVQKIHRKMDGGIEKADLRNADGEAQAREIAVRTASEPFDLENGPLFRIKLLQLADDRHAMIIVMHHIICDGWSFDVLEREMLFLYNSLVRGRPAKLPPPEIQYRDYAAWQNELLEGEKASADRAYWLEKLGGTLPILDLPTDRLRPPIKTFDGNTETLLFDPETAAGLEKYAKSREASMFMTLAAALKVLLYRYTGQDDIVIGSPVSGRNHPALEDQVGFYVNTIALRDSINGDENFGNLLSRVKQTVIDAHEHQSYPFDKLVEELDIPRDAGRTPVFDVMLVFQNEEQTGETPETELKISSFEYDSGASQFDLTFIFNSLEDGDLRLDINYNTDLFEPETVRRMETHFEELVKSLLEDENRPVSSLNILAEPEKKRILCDFNDDKTDYPKDKTLVDLFAEQVEKTPDNIAVIFEDRRLTYRELDRASDSFAAWLVNSYKIEPGETVGFIAERNELMIVGLMGTLKAGGVWLPIDPGIPANRIDYMIENSGCKLLFGDPNVYPENVGLKVCDPEKAFLKQDKAAMPGLEPGDLAYIIYTSGSTGTPKGVMVRHRGFVNMILCQIDGFEVSETDRVLQFSSASFDASLSEIFMALLKGAAVVMISRDVFDEPALFLDYVGEHDVSVVTFPPAYLNMMNRDPMPSVRTIITAGEPAIPDDARFYSENRRYYNAYGPTEASVCTSFHRVRSVEPGNTNIPIGKPVANLPVYVLDGLKNPVPVGVPGEIFVSGIGLAKGYLGKPELTAEKFVENPFAPGERMYMTGDLGKWLPDGSLQYLGRIDDQVKIRGYRIEPGEIKSMLIRRADIRDAAVVPLEDASGGLRLVAYIVPDDRIPDSAELRMYLGRHLPEYMIPSAFVPLEYLPLTSNGKVDKKSLPKPGASVVAGRSEYIAPRNAEETSLAAIWESVLGTGPVGITDSFFDLGGHSLLAVRLMNRIESEFGKRLPMAELFRGPTVEHLASVLADESAGVREALVQIRSDGDKHPIFCLPGAGGGVGYFQALSRHVDRPVYGLQTPNGSRGIEDTAAVLVEAVREAQPEGPYNLAGHSLGGWVAFEMARQLEELGETVAFLGIMDIGAPNIAGSPTTGETDPDDAELIAETANALEAMHGSDLNLSYDVIRNLEPEERLEMFRERMETAGLLAPNSDISEVREMLNVVKENLKTAYDPGETRTDRIVLFRSNENEHSDDAMGWEKHSMRPVSVHTVPGGHYSMMAEPHVAHLADKMKECLDER